MPPRKKPKRTRNRDRETQNGARLTYSRAIQSSESAAGYNRPITRSRVLPPIHRLPLEVLSEIFILALPTDQELYRRRSQSYKRQKLINPTLVFCAVCSSWRFLAFSTPRLWNMVLIRIPHDINEAQAKRKAADLVQWIERSRSLPIALHIYDDNIKRPNGEGPEASIISVINDHAARWESLYFQSFQPSSPSFHFDGWHSLRRLYYPCLDPVSCTNETVLWAHLTHLQIWKFIPCQAAAMIFMKCPKLAYLSIPVVLPATEQSTVPIILENLVIFHLMTDRPDCLQTFVDRLSLPSVREFSISEISPRDIQPLLNLLTRSSCSLDKLEIHGVSLLSEDYLDVLAHSSCDSLTSLTLRPSFCNAGGSVDEVLRRLTLHRNDTMCHHLTFLAIGYCIPTPLHSVLLNMVESRIKSHTGQVPEGPVLHFLQLCIKYLRKNTAEWDKVGRRSGMEYSRQRFEPGCLSVRFRTQGFKEPPNFSELFWS